MNTSHKFQSFKGKLQKLYRNAWFHFQFITANELQFICKYFGFNYGTIIRSNIDVLEMNYLKTGIYLYNAFSCNNTMKNSDDCKFELKIFSFEKKWYPYFIECSKYQFKGEI